MAYGITMGIGTGHGTIPFFMLDGLHVNNVVPAELDDLQTLWSQDYQPALHAALAVGATPDDATLVEADRPNAIGYDGEDDMNTAYAKHITVDFG